MRPTGVAVMPASLNAVSRVIPRRFSNASAWARWVEMAEAG